MDRVPELTTRDGDNFSFPTAHHGQTKLKEYYRTNFKTRFQGKSVRLYHSSSTPDRGSVFPSKQDLRPTSSDNNEDDRRISHLWCYSVVFTSKKRRQEEKNAGFGFIVIDFEGEKAFRLRAIRQQESRKV